MRCLRCQTPITATVEGRSLCLPCAFEETLLEHSGSLCPGCGRVSDVVGFDEDHQDVVMHCEVCGLWLMHRRTPILEDWLEF